MEQLDVKSIVRKFQSMLTDEDSATVQGVLVHITNGLADPDFNVGSLNAKTTIKVQTNDEEGVIILHIGGLNEVSMRRLFDTNKSYSRIIACTVNTPVEGNNPLTITVVINKAASEHKKKEQHTPKADNRISNVMDGLKWTGKDLSNIKHIEKDVIDMDLSMLSPKWEILDREDTYVLVATPIHNVSVAFYEYITHEHPGVIENIIFRTESAKPASDPAPRFEIYCNQSRKTTRAPSETTEDDTPQRPTKKTRRNNFYEG